MSFLVESNRPTELSAAEPDPLVFIRQVESAHGTTTWKRQFAIQTSLKVKLNGQPWLNGELLIEPNAAKGRLQRQDGATLWFEGRRTWVLPSSTDWKSARFDATAWAYLLALPHKLENYGVRLTPGPAANQARISFDPGVGMTPADRFTLFRDPDSWRLTAIEVYPAPGPHLPLPFQRPFRIELSDFQDFEGVPVARLWRLFALEAEAATEPFGEVVLEELRFMPNARSRLVPPPDALPLSCHPPDRAPMMGSDCEGMLGEI